ncbi:putative ribonuclease H-like domain-containing protein [Tanacetum coccineum]
MRWQSFSHSNSGSMRCGKSGSSTPEFCPSIAIEDDCAPFTAKEKICKKNELLLQKDLNVKFLRSLPSEWDTHVVKRSTDAINDEKNLAFLTTSGASSINNINNVNPEVSTGTTKVNTASTETICLSDAPQYNAFLSTQPQGSQQSNEDLEQTSVIISEKLYIKVEYGTTKPMRQESHMKRTERKIIIDGRQAPRRLVLIINGRTWQRKKFQANQCSHGILTPEILLKIPRQDNMYSFDMKNIVPKDGLTCLVAKATSEESMLWHRRLGHVNFKNINKLVKENLVRDLPLKRFENDQTCVACLKGKKHRASCKTKAFNPITKPLFMLHMDLFLFQDFVRKLFLMSVVIKGNKEFLLESITSTKQDQDNQDYIASNTRSKWLHDVDCKIQKSSMMKSKHQNIGTTGSTDNTAGQKRTKRVSQALRDPAWVEAMQEELLQFKLQKVWVLVDLPKVHRAIGMLVVLEVLVVSPHKKWSSVHHV